MKKPIPDDAVLVPDGATLDYQGVIFDVHHWDEVGFDGSTMRFEMLRRSDSVCAICLVDGKIIVLDEVQPHRGALVNFPGGRVDHTDADIYAATQREVREETGYSFKHWRLVMVSQPMTKIEWFVYRLVAWDVVDRAAPQLDSGEQIICKLLEFDTVKEMALSREGHIAEAASIFKAVDSADGLKSLPVYHGRIVDR